MAPGASEVSTSTSRRSAVSCDERHTSSACCSGESSGANGAWMPPCAFDELFGCSDPLVATATRAPTRAAETAAASPEAPLPITSTSKGTATVMEPTLPNSPNATHQAGLSPDRRQELLDLACRRRSRVALVALAGRRHLGHCTQALRRHAEVSEALEA